MDVALLRLSKQKPHRSKKKTYSSLMARYMKREKLSKELYLP